MRHDDEDLLRPGNITIKVPITGLRTGDFFLGIDFRPADGILYGVANSGAIYRINVATGAATLVSILTADPADTSSPFSGLSGTSFGVDSTLWSTGCASSATWSRICGSM